MHDIEHCLRLVDLLYTCKSEFKGHFQAALKQPAVSKNLLLHFGQGKIISM